MVVAIFAETCLGANRMRMEPFLCKIELRGIKLNNAKKV